MLLRLLCGPAVLLAAQTSSSLQQPRPGCCCVPEACAHEIFCCMLFAVPFLLTSNGQRVKILPRLLCVPARLLPASSIESSWFSEARLVLRSRVVRARNFLLYVVRRACLTYLQWPAVETFSPASVCSCSPASSRLCMLSVAPTVSSFRRKFDENRVSQKTSVRAFLPLRHPVVQIRATRKFGKFGFATSRIRQLRKHT